MRWSARTLTVVSSAVSVLGLAIAMTVVPATADVTSSVSVTAPLDLMSPVQEWTQAQMDARYQAFRERINELRAQGKTQAEIDATIADEFGIIRLSADTTVDVPLEVKGEADGTTASNVSMYTPTFSYDTMLHKYVMAASWQWKTCADYNRACWTNDKSSAGNVGGPDGMAIKINRPIFRSSAGISTNDNCGTPKINNNQADTDTGYGVAFIEQDVISYSSSNGMCAGTPFRYNWHRGTVSETFTFQSSCGGIQLQIDSKIGHTWSSTSVNSIGVSTSGISFSWSSSNYRWNAIPNTPAYDYC